MSVVRENTRTLLPQQNAAAERSRNIANLSAEVARINSVLLAALAESENISEGELFDRAQPYLNRLQALEIRLQEQPSVYYIDDADADLYGRLVDRFTAYQRESVSAVLMTSVEKSRAHFYLAEANAAFQDLFDIMSRMDVENRRRYQTAVANVESNYDAVARDLALGLGLAIILTAIIALAVSQALVRDLVRLIGRMTDLSEGRQRDLPLDVTRKDELGDLARGIANFEEALKRLGAESEARRRRERDLSDLFEYSGDAILLVANGQYVAANRRAEELFECPRDEIIGLPAGTFSAVAGGSPALQQARREFEKDETKRSLGPIEWSNRTRTGKVFDSEVTYTSTRNEDDEIVQQMIIRDVSERKEVERLRTSMTEELERLVAERTAALEAETAARRETDDALAEIREMLALTVDNAPVGIIVLDEDLKVKLVNRRFYEQHGPAADVVEAGKPFELFVRAVLEREMARSPERQKEIERVLEQRMQSLRRRESADFEGLGTNLKISRRYVSGFGYVITNVDISELKAAEARIDAARRLLLATVDNAPAGIMLVDEDLNVRIVNDTYRQIFGFAPDDTVVGESYVEIMRVSLQRRLADTEDGARKFKDEFARRALDIESRGDREFTETRPGGRSVKVTRNYIDGTGYVITAVDISDVVRAESALAEQRQLLNTTIENAPVGIAVLDENAVVRLVNNQFKQAQGDAAEELVVGSRFDDFLRRVCEREIARQPERAAELTETFQRRINGLFERKDFVLEGVGTNLQINRRYIPGFGHVITNVDVSDLKRVEAELRRALGDLRDAQEELIDREKMAALGRLVAGLAHEINTPIGVCVTAATYLIDSFGELREKLDDFSTDPNLSVTVESIREGLVIIERNLGRAANLVGSFKQVAVDQTLDDIRRIDLADYVDEVLVSLGAETRRAKLEIDFRRSDRPLQCTTRPGAIAQIVTNLVMDVIEHAYPAGEGGRVEIELDKSSDETVCLTVRDFGVGMDAETRSRVFEPFFTTRRGSGGTGLGLHIVYNLATRSLGGSIRCASTPGEGTEFVLEIPPELDIGDSVDGRAVAAE